MMLRERSVFQITAVCLLIACLILFGCSKADSDEGAGGEGGQAKVSEAPIFAQAGEGQEIEPVPVETLTGFLPDTLAGMEQSDMDTDTMTIMEVTLTEAYADYNRISGPGDMQLSITDVGNASGPAALFMTGWAMSEVNNQSDTEYEKTTTFQGYKAFEEYNHQGPSGAFTVLVANRFIVEVSGSRVTMETLKEAVGQVDLKKLAEAGKQ